MTSMNNCVKFVHLQLKATLRAWILWLLAIVAHTSKTPTWGKEGKIDRKNEQNQ
jgi:hypothetical protein